LPFRRYTDAPYAALRTCLGDEQLSITASPRA
jgi:hypothetical protein